jgi:hypothetical protein
MKRISFILTLLMAGRVSAIIVSDYSVATNPPTGDWNVNWDNVYRYKGSSAVAVGSHWLLTAAHVADDNAASNIVAGGVTYYQQEIIFHTAADDPEHSTRADLALVRFDKEFPGYYPLYTGIFPGDSRRTSRLSAVMVGYGRTGTVYSTYYNELPPGNGIKRWGSQKVDGTDSQNYLIVDDRFTPPATNVVYNDGIKMMFVLGETLYEAGAGVYDSGGGTFVKDGDGIWKLAGINTIRYPTTGNTNYTGTFAVSVPAYETWATNVMNPTGDLDGDGIPNYWEQQYGTMTGLVVSADNDIDGFSNLQEYTADTNPTNAASFFEMSGFLASTNQTIYFTGSTARQYQVFYTANDLAATNLTWSAAHTNKVWGAGTNSAITVTNMDGKAFYRLWVTLP